jgi:hypothetical protein
MVSRVNDRSRVECLDFGTYLAYYDESAERRRAARLTYLKLAVFVMFLISATGFYSIGYNQLAAFTIACGVNVSVFMLDQYTHVSREQMEGIWISRVKIEPASYAGGGGSATD